MESFKPNWSFKQPLLFYLYSYLLPAAPYWIIVKQNIDMHFICKYFSVSLEDMTLKKP